VEAAYERLGIGTYPWILEISGAAAALFFAGFLGAAGTDAWKGLKALIVKLYDARAGSRAPKGVVMLIDEPTHEWVLIREDLPDEAWQQLLTMGIPKTKSGQLRWDDKARAWRDTWEIETDPREGRRGGSNVSGPRSQRKRYCQWRVGRDSFHRLAVPGSDRISSDP